MESFNTRLRLSSMMFGLYLIMGTWIVTLPTFLMASPSFGGMNFSAVQAAWIYGTLAIGSVIAPLIIGPLADRFFPAQQLMAVLQIIGAGLLLASGIVCLVEQPQIASAYQQSLAQREIKGISVGDWEAKPRADHQALSKADQDSIMHAIEEVNQSPRMKESREFAWKMLFVLMLGYGFCNAATITLSNVIGFRNLHDPRQSFGKIRLYGTIGWIVAGVQVEFLWNTSSPIPLLLAGGMSVLFAGFCLTLPQTPPSGRARSIGEAIGLPALQLFRQRAFMIIILCALGMACVQQFYSVYSNRFLTEMNTPYPTAVQTIAQVSEVICMLLFSRALGTLGMKWTMALGLLGWVLRNGIFATMSLPWIIFLGLPLHGMSYCFFFILASVCIDRIAPLQLRGSAQGIFTFISLGAGTLLGNWCSSRIVQANTSGNTVDWYDVWMIPMLISAGILMVFVFWFRTTSDDVPRLSADSGDAGSVHTASNPDSKSN